MQKLSQIWASYFPQIFIYFCKTLWNFDKIKCMELTLLTFLLKTLSSISQNIYIITFYDFTKYIMSLSFPCKIFEKQFYKTLFSQHSSVLQTIAKFWLKMFFLLNILFYFFIHFRKSSKIMKKIRPISQFRETFKCTFAATLM